MTTDPNTHFFLNEWLQNRFLILNIGTTSAGKTYTTFRILEMMSKAKHPPSHIIFCTTSGGLDRTLRKESKKINQELEFATIEELPERVQELIAYWVIVKRLRKMLSVPKSQLIEKMEEKLQKLEDDMGNRYSEFTTITNILNDYIKQVREVLHKTRIERKRTPHGIVTVEKPLFTKQRLREGYQYYQDLYGSEHPINVVVCVDDYMSDKQLVKNGSLLQQLIVKRRHLGLSFVINLQRLVQGISKTIRSLVNTFILFKGVPTYDLEQVAQAMGVPPRDKNSFIDKYNEITKQYTTVKGQKYYHKAIASVEKQELFTF